MESDDPAALGSDIRGAHLVGSVPLQASEDVFRQVAQRLGRHLRRIPDGETGLRAHWIAWQLEVFKQVQGLESEVVDIGYLRRAKFRLAKGAPDEIRFPALGYSRAAIDSYALFARLREAGALPRGMKFQVCLPTPLAPLHAYVFPESMAALLEPYEAAMRRELEQIVSAIPHGDLALQWDTAIEFAVFEGVMPTVLSPGQILRKLTEYGDAVPPAVELGYHLCYGDSGHKHFKEPADATWLVRVANHLAQSLARRLDWLHLPVPRERFDDAFYCPLALLSLAPATELYLGLVHMTDGAEGTRRRIAAARRYVQRFGVGTECGFGRRPPQTLGALLDIHTAVSAPLA